MLGGKEWALFLQRIQICSTFFSILVNIFLIFLISAKSPKQIGAYKYLMIYISVFEIFYSLIDGTINPIIHSFGSAFVVIVQSRDSILNPFTLIVINSLYWGCFGASLAIFGIHFIYRYFVATGSQFIKTFNSWKIAFWLLTPIFFGSVWTFVGFFICAPTDATTRHIKHNINETFGFGEDDFVYLGPYFYENTEIGTTIVHWPQLLGISIDSITVSISFFTVIYFGVKTYKSINALVEGASRSNTTLQTQFFYALVVQTIIPVFLMHIPAFIVILFTFLNINIGMLSGVMSITISMYPALDPLPTLFIIKNYRVAFIEYILFIPKCFCSLAKTESRTRTAIELKDGATPSVIIVQ